MSACVSETWLRVCVRACARSLASACTSAFLYKAAFLCSLKRFVFLIHALVGGCRAGSAPRVPAARLHDGHVQTC